MQPKSKRASDRSRATDALGLAYYWTRFGATPFNSHRVYVVVLKDFINSEDAKVLAQSAM
jgi:hypothetical protein